MASVPPSSEPRHCSPNPGHDQVQPFLSAAHAADPGGAGFFRENLQEFPWIFPMKKGYMGIYHEQFSGEKSWFLVSMGVKQFNKTYPMTD